MSLIIAITPPFPSPLPLHFHCCQLKTGISMLPRLASNYGSSCPCLQSNGIICVPGPCSCLLPLFANHVLAFLEACCDIHILFPTLQMRKQELTRLKNLTLLNLVVHIIILARGSLRQEDHKLEVVMRYIKTKQIQLRQQMTSVLIRNLES